MHQPLPETLYFLNRIYNRILDRDWFFVRLFIMAIGLTEIQFAL